MATIFAISGATKGLQYQLTKPRTSIGKAGGGADIEIDDHQASVLHCAVTGTKGEGMLRLYTLGSANGTCVNGERIEAVSPSHCSEFGGSAQQEGVAVFPFVFWARAARSDGLADQAVSHS